MKWLALAVAMCIPVVSNAFCGTYVGGAGDEIYNSHSAVAIAHDGSITTLTVANNATGDLDNFALVIPIPSVLLEDAVRVVDPAVFDRLDLYSQPRTVSYTCAEINPEEQDTDTDTDSDSDTDADTDVDVEAKYIVGEYEVNILSARESSKLITWLQDNGYAVPDDSKTVLQSYIDQKQVFLAAKVNPEEPLPSGTFLSPLQMEYPADRVSLPIRIGTLDSPGVQDLTIYGLTPYVQGAMAISNYPQVEIEDECLYDPSLHGDFGAFYAGMVDSAHVDADSAVWVEEYSWGGGHCDPCSAPSPDESDLITLGHTTGPQGLWFSRLHMRYSADQATQDLVMYFTGDIEPQQQRYIAYKPEFEDIWPICTLGWATDPGTCPGVDGENPNGETPDIDVEVGSGGWCGFPVVPSPLGGLVLFGLGAGAALLRRRASG